MPVLARLRLGSVGCPSARFDPLDLELVGSDLRLRHTLLWLRNGGGKSSLIALTLLLLNPRSVASTLGKTSKGDPKVESDYVLRDETGIVLAEWLPDHPTPGRRRTHVTFMALQRGEQEGVAEKAFVAATLPEGVDSVEAFELHQLRPIADRVGRTALGRDAILKRARKLQQEHPDWEVWPVPQHEPGQWEARLRSIGLDPGLAQLLARMNLEEGDLAKALTFASADEFLLQTARLLSPPGDVVRDLHKGLGAWSGQYRDRADKRLAQEELARVRPFWTALVDRLQAQRVAIDALLARAVDARALLDGVELARELVGCSQEEAAKALEAAQTARAAATSDVERLMGEVAALELLQARYEQARAASRVAHGAEEERRAKERLALARAALPALRLLDVERRHAALVQQRRARQAEMATEFQRRDALALGLAAHHAVVADGARDEERVAQERERAARAAITDGQSALETALRSATSVQVRRDGLVAKLAEARRAVAGLVTDGLLGVDERLAAGLERTQAALAERRDELANAESGRAEARAAAKEAETRAAEGRRRAESLVREKSAAGDALAQAQRVCAELTGRLVAAQLPDLMEPRLPQDGERAHERLASACRSATTRQIEEAARLAGLEETCRALSEQDGPPAAHDVRRVAAAAAGLEPGLDYARRNLGDDAREVLTSVPGLAHGVVAGTAAALARAQDRLLELELDLDTPVPVYLAATLSPGATSPGGPRPEAIVGLSPHVSGEARDLLLERRLAERERVRALVHELDRRGALLETLRREVTDGLARHGVERQGQLRGSLTALDAQILEVSQSALAENERRRAALARRQALDDEIGRLRVAVQRQDEQARRLAVAVDRHEAVLGNGPDELKGLDAQLGQLEHAVGERRSELAAASADLERASQDRAKAAERRRDAERESRDLRRLVEDPTTPAVEVLAERRAALRAELDALHTRLVAGERALELLAQELRAQAEQLVREVEEEAGSAERATVVRSTLPPDLDEARARAMREEAEQALRVRTSESGQAQEAQRRARDREKKARGASSRLDGGAREAAERLLLDPPQESVVDGVLATTAALRQEAQSAHQRAMQDEAAARQRSVEVAALAERWERLVGATTEAWEAVTTGPEAEAIVRAALGIVKEGRNAQVVLDPAKQVKALEHDAEALRRGVLSRRRELEQAEAAWLAAAREAAATADRSSSASVRNLVIVRHGADDAEPIARARALGRRAQDDLAYLDVQLEDLAAQLADVAHTQRTLAQQLGQHALDLAQRIMGLERASVLPPGLGRWSNEQFLKVDLPVVKNLEDLTGVLERMLAEWADKEQLPTQRDLIAVALTRGLTGRPHVSMPKADRFDHFRRRPIQQIGKDSGGEALTAAFILFCVLARVVTSGRPGARGLDHRVALALIDNPLGTANRFDFVEAQCRVAAAFGVQYIAASGITDVAAVERFERLVTLTNPSQARVQVSRVEDHDLYPGRPIQSVLAARGDVLTPSGAEPRRWLNDTP